MAWTVLIVDDHAGFRASARACSRPTVSRSSARLPTGRRRSKQARRLRPQVVLLDIQLPGMDGFAVAERLAAEPAAPAVVLISSRGRGTFRGRLATTSARGFITKAEFSGECLSLVLA